MFVVIKQDIRTLACIMQIYSSSSGYCTLRSLPALLKDQAGYQHLFRCRLMHSSGAAGA